MNKEFAIPIENYLKNNHQNMLQFLEKLVACESPSRNSNSQKKIIKLLKDAFKRLHYDVLEMPGSKTGGFLYARPANRIKHQAIQLIIGHCDTVWELNTLQKMPIRFKNKKMFGPGIFDMKAGLTQIIFTLEAIASMKLNCELTPVILINSDEEIGSIESTSTIKKLAKLANRAFILEPPLGQKGKLKTTRKGIGKFNLVVRGKPAHAGLNPEKGVSAIVEMSHQIQQLYSMNDVSKGISVNVGMIEGGTSANVVAAESRAVIDVRVQSIKDAAYISKKLLNLKPTHEDVEVEVKGYFGRPPLEKTVRNQKLWVLAKSLGELIGLNLEEANVGGGSDGNTTSLYTATLDGLGTTGDGAHAIHEFIFIDKLVERTALLTLLLTSKGVNYKN